MTGQNQHGGLAVFATPRSAGIIFLLALILAGCGGGGTSLPPPLTADFSFSAQPSSVPVAQGASATLEVSVTGMNGFNSTVSILISGMPSGVTATPSQFSLTPGAQQTVTLSASASAVTGNTMLTVAGTSGSLSHSSHVTLAVSGPPDFALTAQPASVSLTPGSSASVAVGIAGTTGFTSQVSITITGLPADVTATPTQFNLSPGSQQTVTFTADSMAAIETASLTVTATSGSLNHSGQMGLAVILVQTAAHPPFRTRYLRTDDIGGPAYWSFFPQPSIIYDPGTKRFFVSNTYLNRVDVFDAITEEEIGEIPVPGAGSGDESPDHSTIYMGTQIGDIYKIDPVTMTVTKRIPAVQIGPTGYQAYEVRVMAGGKLALLGGQGGIPGVDGYANFAVWNPTDNSLKLYASLYGKGESPPNASLACDSLTNISQLALTADRTKIIVMNIPQGGAVCLFDPTTQKGQIALTPANSSIFNPILVPPDGKEIIIGNGSTVSIYDPTGLFQTDQFQLAGSSGFNLFTLSFDGGTLFAVDQFNGTMVAYDWKTHLQKGWVANYPVYDNPSIVIPMVADETGLIAGMTGHGVAFLDGASLQLSARPWFQFGFATVVQPSSGSVQGGTPAVITGLNSTSTFNKVYFGYQLATGVSASTQGVSVTTPAGPAGPVDVAATTSDGGVVMFPEGYSYGPSIVEVVPNASTAEGGGTGFIYGYGLGPSGTSQSTDVQLSIGGNPVTISKYSGLPPAGPYPFPLEYIEFTIPPGTAGTRADITLTSPSAGSTTAQGAMQYLPSTLRYTPPGVALAQGTYDPLRDLYYFTDAAEIQVFSKPEGKWQAPIVVPHAVRLLGIALSPDGSKLAVTDAGNNTVDVLNPDSPANLTTYPLANTMDVSTSLPCGVAITDSGIVYYASFNGSGYGGFALHKLDTATGIVQAYTELQDVTQQDSYIRVHLTSDNSRVFICIAGYVYALDTATDTIVNNPISPEGDYELTVSSNGTWMSAGEYLMDTNLNPQSFIALNDREVWNQSAVYGEKISPDGNLLFSPLSNALDVFDGRTGIFRSRVALPFALCPNYDALVSDGKDNVLVAITGANGNAIAVIDLSSLPEPPPLPFFTAASRQPDLFSIAGGLFSRRASTIRPAVRPESQWTAKPHLQPGRIPHLIVNRSQVKR